MVSEDPERAIVLSYAPTRRAAAALAALLALDDKLGEVLRTTSEPMVGQIRLKWWYDAVCALDDLPPPAEPVLQQLADDGVMVGLRGSELAAIPESWGELLGDALDEDVLTRFAERGGTLFVLAGRVAGAGERDPLRMAGEGWALADLARSLSDPTEAAQARALAEMRLGEACAARWSRNGRALGAMAHLARMDLAGRRVGSPRRILRLLWHRFTGS